jgi:hypothetical protein
MKLNKLKIGILAAAIHLILVHSATAQTAPTTPADTSYWTRGMKGTLTFTQVSLTNWAAGGNNSVSLNAYLNTFANYAKDRTTWENNLELGYGLVDQGNVGIRKSDDKIILTTKYGYKIKKDNNHLFWSTLLDFKTQFDVGYEFSDGDTKTKISDFMAPGYLTIASGLEIKRSAHFNLLYAPVAGKITVVNSDFLSSQEGGAYGVKQGENTLTELGSFMKISFKKDIAKNINLESKLELFTAYDEHFGNVDVNWQNALLMKVNDWLSASLVTQLIYDDDIDIVELDDAGVALGSGPKIQFKQIFGLGLSYTIGDK